MTSTMPARFPDRTQRAANRDSHLFAVDGDEVRCLRCDCRYGGVIHEWPCGADVPREPIAQRKEDA